MREIAQFYFDLLVIFHYTIGGKW